MVNHSEGLVVGDGDLLAREGSEVASVENQFAQLVKVGDANVGEQQQGVRSRVFAAGCSQQGLPAR
ncbi:MAG: hypothetical protein ACI8Y4_002388 [Candidatus Poriferisodalaceae bacterium]